MLAVSNPAYQRLVIAFLTVAAVAALGGVFDTFMNTFFWGLAAEDLRWLGFTIFGAALGIVGTAVLQKRFEKKHLMMAALGSVMVFSMLKVGLRFADLLPENGDPMLLVALVAQDTLIVVGVTVAMTIFPSMVADLVDEQELRTGERQEGVLSSVLGFVAKASGSIGIILGGLLLDHYVQFPTGEAQPAVAADTLFRLAIADGILSNLLMLIPIALIARYSLDRAEVARIQGALRARRQGHA